MYFCFVVLFLLDKHILLCYPVGNLEKKGGDNNGKFVYPPIPRKTQSQPKGTGGDGGKNAIPINHRTINAGYARKNERRKIMKQVINRKLFDTETANIVATNKYWDGSNWDRNGRSQTLYRTSKGRFFIHYETRWQGERDHLNVINDEEAKNLYEILPEHEMAYKDAFGEEPENA